MDSVPAQQALIAASRVLASLRSEVGTLDEPDIGQELLWLLRRAQVGQLAHSRYLVAVVGPQGSGKTTLVRTLYGLDDTWLAGNLGVGERLPVLVSETPGIEQPQGRLAELVAGGELCWRDAEPGEWQRAVRGSRDDVIATELCVPQQHFDGMNGAGWLLLPGYQMPGQQMQQWQVLMRQALAAAGVCVVVTDHTRLAGKQEALQSDLTDFTTRMSLVVAVSKTDGELDETREAELSARAAEVFGPGTQAPSEVPVVFPTPQSDGSWIGALMNQLSLKGNVAVAADESWAHWQEKLADDTLAAQRRIRGLIADLRIENAEAQREIDTALDAYDRAVRQVRGDYAGDLGRALDGHAQRALSRARDDYRPGGFPLIFGRRGSPERAARAVTRAWARTGPGRSGFAQAHLEVLTTVTNGEFAVGGQPAGDGRVVQLSDSLLVRSAHAFDRALPASVADDLGRLAQGFEPGDTVSLDWQRSIELLPAIGLDWLRIADTLPEMRASASRITEHREGLELGLSQDILDQLAAVPTYAKALTAFIGIDLAVDGEINSIPAVVGGLQTLLTGAATPGGAALLPGAVVAGPVGWAVLGAAALVAGAHLARAVRRQVDKERESLSEGVAAMRDAHEDHYLDLFDRTMDSGRRVLEYRLAHQFGITSAQAHRTRLIHLNSQLQQVAHDLHRGAAEGGRP